MSIFDAIAKAEQLGTQLQHLQGRSLGLIYGIVTDRDDPDDYGRVRCTTAALGGNGVTDWLIRMVPMAGISTPVPPVGAVVPILYVEGNPHQGVYLGVITNDLNPAQDKDALHVTVGDVGIVATERLVTVSLADTSLELSKTAITMKATDVTINGSKVMVVGGTDSRGDTMVSPGY
jgi:phage baseplate assembly protein gpV